DVAALEVEPAVAAAVEDAVVGLVDLAVAVGPDGAFGGRVHERVHAARGEARAVRLEAPVDLGDGVDEVRLQAREVGDGAAGLELDDVRGELVGGADGAELDVVGDG